MLNVSFTAPTTVILGEDNTVTVTVTLAEPENLAGYNAIKDKTLTITFTYIVTAPTAA